MTRQEPYPAPAHSALVTDLRLLRERGLLRLRRLGLPALHQAARAAALTSEVPDVTATESLLRRAVAALGEEEPGRAAQYLFGLVQGTAGRRPTDLRETAATIYGLSRETFRKEPERLLVDRVADEILLLCHAAGARAAGEPAADTTDAPPRPANATPAAGPAEAEPATPEAQHDDDHRHGGSPDTRGQLDRAIDRLLDGEGPGRDRFGPFAIPLDSRAATVVVRRGTVELVRGVDIVVSSENTYLQPSREFTGTLSGRIRGAAARRNAAGAVIEDVVVGELTRWLAAHVPGGSTVELGTVAPTAPGRLAERGVRRIYHAAVVLPRPQTNAYDITASGVMSAVRHCFDLARTEREGAEPGLRSIMFPLFGAGQGGITAEESFAYLWPGLVDALTTDPTWDVHLSTWRTDETVVVLRGLARALNGGP